MATRKKHRTKVAPPVWERPEPPSRPAPGPLSRDRIVRAAIAIADARGLEAVSLRNVGAALKAGPMRLYGYLSTKEELLDLMVDAAYAEMDSGPPVRGSWREALRTSAHRVRSAARAHAWLVELLGGRPNQGPNALAHLEASLAVLSGLPGFEDIDTVIQAVGTVDAYVIGALRMEASELRAQAQSGLTEKEWQATTAPYIFSMLATGRFPQIDRVVRDSTDTPFEVMFDRGLECVLDGIAARLARS